MRHSLQTVLKSHNCVTLGSAGRTKAGDAVPVSPSRIDSAKLKYPHPQFVQLVVKMLPGSSLTQGKKNGISDSSNQSIFSNNLAAF